MKNAKAFFDSNVLLYLLSADDNKADRAEAVIAKRGTVNVQVLNEFASVARRKLKMSYAEIREVLQTIRGVCSVEAVTIRTHDLGLDIAERYGFSLYDSMVVSAALASGCTILYSEDLQHGQRIENRLLVVDPFLNQPA